MKSVREAKRLLLAIAVVLLLIDAAAISWLISPAGRSSRVRQQDLRQLRTEYQAKIREVGPAREMDKKLAQAREQQAAFYNDHIPAYYSAISETLAKLASENQVQVSAIHYEPKDSEIHGLQRVGISALVTGDYRNQMKFINALERSKMFFVINSVNLGSAESGNVRLDLRLETYLRSVS